MKFIYLTDIHFRETTPRARNDINIMDTLEMKFIHLQELIQKEGVEFVVHGGDIGHSYDWKLSLASRVSKIIKRLKVPFYSIVGNHDVPGKNISLLSDTGIGYLFDKKIIKRITSTTPTTVGNYRFYGFDSDTIETDDLLSGKWDTTQLDSNYINFAIVHAPIGKSKVEWEIYYKDLDISGFDFLFAGDIHTGFPLHKLKSGTVVGNPGTFFRQKVNEMNQKVMIYLVENKTVREIEIPSNNNCWKINKVNLKVFSSVKKLKELTIDNTDLGDLELFRKVGSEMKLKKKEVDEFYNECYN